MSGPVQRAGIRWLLPQASIRVCPAWLSLGSQFGDPPDRRHQLRDGLAAVETAVDHTGNRGCPIERLEVIESQPAELVMEV